jgi:hypothetical protein
VTNSTDNTTSTSCPRGITFGDTVTLSPSNEDVIDPKTAYFNNGDYVVIWTEKTSDGPRLEFQLFNRTDYKIGCKTNTTEECPGEYVTQPGMDIGNTAVGVYEDYTFLIAWSLSTLSDEAWYIKIRSFKYNLVNATYTSTNDHIPIVKTSAHNHGKFGFATLSMDNGFVLAYMRDPYIIEVPIYKQLNNYTSPVSKAIERVKSSYLMEFIVKAVPTQYFFSVIWSPLMKGRGITVKNYKTEDGTAVATMDIDANPRAIYADLSYGGTGAVAWHEATTDCSAQQYLTYKAQMYSDATKLGGSFEISNNTNREENLDTYLQQVITQSQNKVVATFLKQEESGDKYIVRIFDNNGNLVTSNFDSLGQTTQSPVAPRARAFEIMVATAAPRTTGRCDRETSELEVDPTLIPDTSEDKPIKKVRITDSGPHYSAFGKLQMVQGANDPEYSLLEVTLDELSTLLTRIAFLGLSNNIPTDTELRLTRKYGDIYQAFFGFTLQPILFLENNRIPLFEYKYNFDNNANLEIFVDTQNKAIYLSTLYVRLPQYPYNSQTYYTKLGTLSQGAFALYGPNEFIANARFTYDECLSKEDLYPSCIRFFIESCYTLNNCVNYDITEVCNSTSTQSNLRHELENLKTKLNLLRNAEFNALSQKVQNIYTHVLGTQHQVPWTTIKNLLNQMYNGFISTGYYFAYAPTSKVCNPTTYAYTVGKNPDSTTAIFFCNLFSDIFSFPSRHNMDTKFLTIAHEISHIYGTTDRFNGVKIYGYGNCNQDWVKQGRITPITENALLIADCVAFFIQAYYCDTTQTCTIPSTGTRNFQIAESINFTEEVNMEQIDCINLNVNVLVTPTRLVTLHLTLNNSCPDNYYIAREALLLDGFTDMPFSISGPSNIPCLHRTSHSHTSAKFLLKHDHSKSHYLTLSDFCLFGGAKEGTYTIYFKNAFHLSDNPNVFGDKYVHLISNTTFLIGETAEDSALQSLTYESGL